MANYLNIKSGDIPIKLDFKVKNRIFKLEVVNRTYDNRLVAHLYDEFDNTICLNEKIVYGMPLFNYLYFDKDDNLNLDMPEAYIVPISIDGIEKEITISNIGISTFLILEVF